MIEVELPDGSIAEFPDGTSNDAIKSALASYRSAPSGHNAPEYAPPGVEGYNPETGLVEREPRSRLASAAYGAADIAGFGFGDELASFPASWMSGVPRDQVLSEMRGNQQQAQEDNPGSYLAGQVGGGLALGTGMVAGGISPAARAIQAGYRLPGVMAASGVEGAAIGGLYGLGSGETADGRLDQAKDGALFGGVLGAAAPAAIAGVSSAARRAITPFRTSPERIAAANTLQREGVPLTAGQRTGSRSLRFAESEIGGARAADIMDDQARAFTDAAMRRAGGRGLATGDNLSALNRNLSQGFEDIASRNNLRADAPFARDLLGTLNEYNRVLPSEQRQILGNIASDIGEKIKVGNGTMTGRDYQTIRSRLTTRAKNARGSDNELAAAYRGLRDALDNAMERSINPVDAGRWGDLRQQWGNMRTLERAAVGGGEEAALGVISPARLRMAASSGNQGAYARGQGDFAELAKAGQAVMTPMPNSGTAARMSARNLGTGVTSMLGAGAGAATGNPAAAIAGMIMGAAIPSVAGRAMMSGPAQSYLSNQIVSGPMSAQARAIANALLTGNTSALTGRLASP